MDSYQRHQQHKFSLAAPAYERLSLVQQAAAKRLFQGLAFLGNATRILDVGCGTGALTRLLAATWPRAEVLGIDLAPGMIEQARRATGDAPQPRFLVSDTLQFTATIPFDLIVSSSSLHWMQPLDRTFAHLAAQLAPGRPFAFSLMLEDTLKELHALRREVAPSTPPAARMPSADHVRAALRAAGLRIEMEEEEEHIVQASDATAMLRDLRDLGVTGGPLSRGERPLNRRELRQLIDAYDIRHRSEHGVSATYHVGYFWGSRDA
jgi:malonyl-CoA O-methyltransferase